MSEYRHTYTHIHATFTRASLPVYARMAMPTCAFSVVSSQVKVGVAGAAESGEAEEWFNLRMRRVAPEVCASFLGSFVSDANKGQFTEGGKWLVWEYEVSGKNGNSFCGCSSHLTSKSV